MKTYWVYILASRTRALYVGVTNNLQRRLWEHRTGDGSAHAFRYREVKLVWCEGFSDVNDAIANEKRIKSWRREKEDSPHRAEESGVASISRGCHPERSEGSGRGCGARIAVCACPPSRSLCRFATSG